MLDALRQSLLTAMPDIYLMVLGGSQTLQDGINYRDPASDYDIVVLRQDEDAPVMSYNSYHGCADIIVRTPGSLAYEALKQAPHSGRGT